MLKKVEHTAQKKYEMHLQLLEDRVHRRQMRSIRRDHGEDDVSDDSEDEDIDKYSGLTEEEKWNRMMNEAREELKEDEVRRLMNREKKRQNALQNKMMRQGQSADVLEEEKIKQEVLAEVTKQEAFSKELVILEPLPCVNTAMEMCLIGYQEALRFLRRNDIYAQFEKASLQQCQMSVELAFQQRKSPIQVKAEMLWRFSVVMHDFMQGARGTHRHKYLVLAAHAYMLLYDQVMLERTRRDSVRAGDDDEAKERLSPEAEWEEGKPDLYWELGALVNSMECEMDDEDAVWLYNEMERVNNASAFARLRMPNTAIAIPEDIAAPDS